nr:immunoglobulin light chain junction region [Macaca mulatta]
CMQVLQIPFTV